MKIVRKALNARLIQPKISRIYNIKRKIDLELHPEFRLNLSCKEFLELKEKVIENTRRNLKYND